MAMQQRTRYEMHLFFLKIGLLLSVFCTFFGFISIYNPQILRFSRTAGVTMVTFAVILPVMMRMYHCFEVERKDSRHIINTSITAACMADLITYFQLLIMNFNEDNRSSLMPVAGEVVCLIAAIVIQLLLIILFTRLVSRLYERHNPPRASCLICSSETDARFMLEILRHYPHRYQIAKTLLYSRDDVYAEISQYDQVFLYNVPYAARQGLVEYCYKLSKPVSYSMEIADIIGYGAEHDMFDDVSFVSASNRRGLTLEQRILKRALDIVCSILILLPSIPVMLICALAIWLYDHNEVIFRQQRATIGGRVFTIYKFRTMSKGADGNRSAQQNDSRITPVGRVLRRFRLDELPQLFNILAGDMSLVGPRPEMLSNLELYTGMMPEFSYRLAVKAGLTGYAQIAGKYNTAPKEKMLMDLMYIEDYSIWRDIKLIVKTVGVLFRKESTEGFHEQPSVPVVSADKENQAV